MKMKFTTNTLLFIFNVNLFALHFVVYFTLSGSSMYQGSPELQREQQHVVTEDDVEVYSNRIKEAVALDEPKEGAIGVARQDHTGCHTTWDWNWDGRADTRSGANRFLYMVRHGQYYANGPYEKHLSPLGHQQAAKVAEKVKSYNITFRRFISSTSIRAAETADVIHKMLPYLQTEYSEELREGWPDFPDPPSPGNWDKNDPIFKTDIPRLDNAFKKYIHRAGPEIRSDSNELIVAHGNVISYFTLRALQVPTSRWLKIAVLQASITLLHIQPNGDIAVRLLGDVGHLDKQDWSG